MKRCFRRRHNGVQSSCSIRTENSLTNGVTTSITFSSRIYISARDLEMTVHKSQGTAPEYRSQHRATSFCRTWTKRTTWQTGTTSGIMSGTVTSLRIRVMEGNIEQTRLWRHRQLQHKLFHCHGLNNKPRPHRSKRAKPSMSRDRRFQSRPTALTLVSVSHRCQSIIPLATHLPLCLSSHSQQCAGSFLKRLQSASRGISCLLWNMRVHYHVNKT